MAETNNHDLTFQDKSSLRNFKYYSGNKIYDHSRRPTIRLRTISNNYSGTSIIPSSALAGRLQGCCWYWLTLQLPLRAACGCAFHPGDAPSMLLRGTGAGGGAS
jgi:hypothetical protein